MCFIWGAFKKRPARGLGTETSTFMSEVLALAVEALVPLQHKVVNGCLVKFPGLCCEPVLLVLLGIVVRGKLCAPPSLFLGDQKWHNHRERDMDCMEGDWEPPTWISARVPWLCWPYDLHLWSSSGRQWTSVLLSEPPRVARQVT